MESSKNQELSFKISNNGSRIKNSDYQDPSPGKNQDISDPLLDGKRESRTEIQDFKRKNNKNWERIMTQNNVCNSNCTDRIFSGL